MILNFVSNFCSSLDMLFLDKYPIVQQALFGVFRFTSGMSQSLYSIAIILAMEMVGPSYRAAAGSCMYYFYILGELVNVLLAYFIRDISMNYLAMSVYLVVCMVGLGFIPESPRFQLIKRKQTQAYDTFLKIAKSNNKTSELINFMQTQDLDNLVLANEKPSENVEVKVIYNFFKMQ